MDYITNLTERYLALKTQVKATEQQLQELRAQTSQTEAELELAVRQKPSLVKIGGKNYAVISRSYDVLVTELFE